MRVFIFFITLLFIASDSWAQFDVSGKIVSPKQKPAAFASVNIPSLDQSVVANDKGEFVFRNLPAGKMIIQVTCLGFAPKNFDIDLKKDTADMMLILEELNLTLKEVFITAQRNANTLSTSYVIDRTVLDHMQLLNATDATSLLPGGKTSSNLSLVSSSPVRIAVNGTGTENGNPRFGVAVELDGVRLSNTSSVGDAGTDTRNIASSNIESIEIITGLPSVEYGDLTNGLVKINTRKGKSPFILDLVTKPNTKQVALGKGIELGPKSGVLTMNLEHTRSIGSIASPYTTYTRNGLSLNYSNSFNRNSGRPLFLEMGLNGNLGGYNSESDPDLFVNTYTKVNDNALRANLSLRWQVNKPWLTSLEATSGFNTNNKTEEQSTNRSAPASTAAIHAMQTGYHVGQLYDENPGADIILINPGYWYQTRVDESKIKNYSARLKANWSKQFANINNRVVVGGEWTSSNNSGRGEYYTELRYAPTWRPYSYSALPAITNYALFAEDRVNIRFKKSNLLMVAGVRSDITAITGSEYGTVSSTSPRFSAEYRFWQKATQRVNDVSIRFSWGKTVKLPSFSMLYPTIGYRDFISFAPGTTSDGKTYYAYYSTPTTSLANPDLKWQQNTLKEINLQASIDGTRVTLTAALDETKNPYTGTTIYSPFTYKFTDQSNLQNVQIPIANRVYSIDQSTGIVTVSDRTGTLPAETLSYREITRSISTNTPVNGSPVTRKRLSWIIDFKQISAIRTSFRIDGNYYHYKGIEQTLIASTLNTTNGETFKYIGFYAGGSTLWNGETNKTVNVNFTSTTHIPALRLIVSARLECSLYDHGQYLSESANGQRSYVLPNRDSYTPAADKTDIYAGNQYIASYPEYYISFDDMQTKIPFAEKFLWAKDNDPTLYNELAKLVNRTNYNYQFNKQTVSPYFSANLAITKELGKTASITFNAVNFINNMAQVKYSQSGLSSSLLGSSTIPAFYYGLSLRLKI